MKARVGSIIDISTIEWRGNTCSMVFFAGCNFQCPYCSNSSLIPLKSGVEVDLETVENWILASIDFIDAVGVTGGEPSLQPNAVATLFEWASRSGLKTFLNTNGTNPELIRDLIRRRILSYVAFDIKAPLEVEAYNRVTGLADSSYAITQVRKTLRICIDYKVPFEVRTTVVPGLIDDDRSIQRIAKELDGHGSYYLQQFFPFEDIPSEELRLQKPPTRERLIQLAKLALNEGVQEVFIRTRNHGVERVNL
ncbi:MAG: anaerobic ribonucleoside-triphosphate reductase activating protein [Candidatus Bathyarchaeia archaeon]